MTIKHMKIFIQVYRTQNITKAAELLHMTQPAVTRAIQEIESYYGICLFERIRRRLFATESAHLFYSKSLHIIDVFDTMEKEMRNGDKFGVIRIGASVTLGNYFLPQLVSRFQKQYEDLSIKVIITNGVNLQKKLLDNELDIALIEGRVGSEELHTEQVGTDHLILVTPPRHPLLEKQKIKLEDIMDYPILLREKGSTSRALLDNYFEMRDLQISPMWESTSTQAIVRAVSYGIGISFLPKQLVNADIENGIISTKDIVDADFTRQHYIVWHNNKFLTDAIRKFIDLCKE